MKNTWNIRKKEDAVSPVIATILMVAITVVLAAVLYVMVIGFGGDGSSTPAGSWNAAAADSQTEGTLTFGAFTTDVAPLDLKIFVKANGTALGEISFTQNTLSPQPLTWVAGAPATAVYTDYNAANGEVNSGDYITFTGLSAGTTYSFEVFHIPSDATVSMTGTNGQFQTPA